MEKAFERGQRFCASFAKRASVWCKEEKARKDITSLADSTKFPTLL